MTFVLIPFPSTEWGSTKTGEQDQFIVTALNCVLRVPRYIPQEQRFDIRVLVSEEKPSSGPAVLFSLVSSEFVIGLFSPQGLGLLINLVEYSSRNRHCLVDMEYTVDNVCLEDAALQPSDPQPSDAAAEPAAEGAAETEAEQTEPEQTVTTGALAALVKVGVVPGDCLFLFNLFYKFKRAESAAVPGWFPWFHLHRLTLTRSSLSPSFFSSSWSESALPYWLKPKPTI